MRSSCWMTAGSSSVDAMASCWLAGEPMPRCGPASRRRREKRRWRICPSRIRNQSSAMVEIITVKEITAKDLTERLRTATWPVHERLHLHPVLRPLTARQPTMDGYLEAVRALYGFVASMEQRLGDEAAGRAARAPLLLADIGTLDAGIVA